QGGYDDGREDSGSLHRIVHAEVPGKRPRLVGRDLPQGRGQGWQGGGGDPRCAGVRGGARGPVSGVGGEPPDAVGAGIDGAEGPQGEGPQGEGPQGEGPQGEGRGVHREPQGEGPQGEGPQGARTDDDRRNGGEVAMAGGDDIVVEEIGRFPTAVEWSAIVRAARLAGACPPGGCTALIWPPANLILKIGEPHSGACGGD